MAFAVRRATTADYPLFARWFLELKTPDPIPGQDRFAAMLPRVVIVEHEGAPCGYGFWQRYDELAHITHVVVDPAARGRGAGRALMDALRERVLAERCARWFLNVKQDNAGAIRLYTRCGMSIEDQGWTLDLRWESVAALPGGDDLAGGAEDAARVAFIATAEDDALLALRLRLDGARLAVLRARPGNVLLGLREHGEPVAFAAFDPAFPGAHQIRARRVELLRPLFQALRRYARPGDDHVHVTVESDRAAFQALVAAGAKLLHETYRMGARLGVAAPPP